MRGSKSVLLVTIFALSLLSPMVSGQNDIVESSVEQMQDRMPFRGEKFSTEDYGWWFTYGPDVNFDGMDDRLERIIAGEESQSTTSIIGADGRKTVAIIVDYAWHPTDVEIDDSSSAQEPWLGSKRLLVPGFGLA